MDSVFSDVRFAIRLLLKSPLHSLALVIVLAVGIGANSAVFSVIDAVLLRPLPYPQPDRLVMLWEKNPTLGAFIGDRVPAAYGNFLEWTRRSAKFQSIAGFEDANFNLTSGAEPERMSGARASANFFKTLRVHPRLGTDFSFATDDPTRTRVTVLSDSFFQNHFGGQPDVIGRTLTLNDVVYTIVGVLPKEFHLPASRDGSEQRKPDLWVPYDPADASNAVEFNRRKMQTYGRLAEGSTIDQARDELRAISGQLAKENPTLNAGYSANVFPVYVEDVGQELRRNLLILLSAVGFVLLIACANIANLMLSRATARGSEMALRKTLGASRSRLISQMLVESLLVSLSGALLGLFVAHFSISLLVSLKPAGINRPEDIHLSVPALLFTGAIAVLTAIIFGIVPALQASRSDARAVMRPGSGLRATPAGLRYMLIVTEVALACVLLSGGAFMMKSLAAVLSVDPGFQEDHLLTMKFSMPPSRYPNSEAVGSFCRQALEKIQALPEVKSVSFSDGLPLTRIRMTKFTVEGQPEPQRGSEPTSDMRGIVNPGYFDSLGMRLIAGRNFTADELVKKSAVIVINQALAQKFWPNVSAVGQHVRSVPSKANPDPIVSTVIGVVGNTHQLSLEEGTRPEITKPMVDYTQLTLAVRTNTEPGSMVPMVKNTIWSIDRYLPVYEVQTMQQIVADSTSQRRFNSFIMAAFASVALILAAVGIYGVLSSLVNARTAEIGIRMALGAQSRNVLTMILWQGLGMVALGLFLGLCGGWATCRFLTSILFGVDAYHAGTYAEVALAMIVLGSVSSFLPAHRATRINPVDALRYE
jgi:putative ABC transport system permease protein